MTVEKMDKVIEDQLNYCKGLLVSKGKEYADDKTDRLQAFKTAARLQGVTPEQALAGMMCKHTVSVYDLIESGSRNLTIWEEKITDHINYLLLLKCLIMDELEASEKTILMTGDGKELGFL